MFSRNQSTDKLAKKVDKLQDFCDEPPDWHQFEINVPEWNDMGWSKPLWL